VFVSFRTAKLWQKVGEATDLKNNVNTGKREGKRSELETGLQKLRPAAGQPDATHSHWCRWQGSRCSRFNDAVATQWPAPYTTREAHVSPLPAACSKSQLKAYGLVPINLTTWW